MTKTNEVIATIDFASRGSYSPSEREAILDELRCMGYAIVYDPDRLSWYIVKEVKNERL